MLGLVLAAHLAFQPTETPSGPIWATVMVEPSSRGVITRLDFGTLGVASQEPRRLAYYVRRTVTRLGNRPVEVTWADSLTCRAVAPVLTGLRQVPPPRIDIPGFPGQPGGTDESVMIDGATYTLALTDQLRFSTNVNSPLSNWTDEALQRLYPCWSLEPPRPVS